MKNADERFVPVYMPRPWETHKMIQKTKNKKNKNKKTKQPKTKQNTYMVVQDNNALSPSLFLSLPASASKLK